METKPINFMPIAGIFILKSLKLQNLPIIQSETLSILASAALTQF